MLALATAAYGALAGPLLRALFGGEALAWPAWAGPLLPPPPTIDSLRLWLPLVVVCVALVKGVAWHRHAVGSARLGQGVVERARARLHSRVLALPPDAARAIGAGELLSRGTHDAEALERLVTAGLVSVVRDGAQAVALVALCFALDWRLALLAFVVYPVAFWPIARLGRRLRRASGHAHEARAALATELHDQLDRLPLVQLSGATEAAERRFGEVSTGVRDAVVRAARVRALASPVAEVAGAVALAAAVWYASNAVARGTLAGEHVMSFLAALLLLYQPVKGLARAQEVIQPGRAALERLDWLLGLPDRFPAGGALAPPSEAPGVEVRDLVVRRGERVALNSATLALTPGRVTAVVGPNGAGKTTLAWALAALVRPDAGEVLVDGVPLERLDAGAWRQRVGWVTQTPLLGRGTMRENVAFGGDASDADLEQAARLAGLLPLVERLPDGWQTRVGDGGAGLSGGERQRVVLARALARRPTLLVLDEPAAHLDAAAREALVTALPEVCAGRTVLLITHDERLAAAADRVVRLSDGRVAEAAGEAA